MNTSQLKQDAEAAAADARVIETKLKAEASFIRTHAKQIAVGALSVALFVFILAHLA